MANLGANFYPKLIQISSELGMKPEDLLAVMVSESGINPSAHEKVHGASGLVQMMPFTLKGLKFNGSPEDFRNLNGEQQLDWVKKLIQGMMPLNGGPFTSAAQYYLANFFPIALKLPGIRQGDAGTVFIEQNPQTVRDKSGRIYSKKYYDIGVKLPPSTEISAYKANPAFQGSQRGAITYGDMMAQVERNKRNPLYNKAISAMQKQTGYTPKNETVKSKEIKNMKNEPIANNFDETLNNFLRMISAEKSYKNIYKSYLPSNDILIKINCDNIVDGIEFSRILSSALDIELMATSNVCIAGNNIELECKIFGPSKECFGAVQELSSVVAETFKLATSKIGGIDIKTNCFFNKKSSYEPLTVKLSNINYRKFLLKFV